MLLRATSLRCFHCRYQEHFMTHQISSNTGNESSKPSKPLRKGGGSNVQDNVCGCITTAATFSDKLVRTNKTNVASIDVKRVWRVEEAHEVQKTKIKTKLELLTGMDNDSLIVRGDGILAVAFLCLLQNGISWTSRLFHRERPGCERDSVYMQKRTPSRDASALRFGRLFLKGK